MALAATDECLNYHTGRKHMSDTDTVTMDSVDGQSYDEQRKEQLDAALHGVYVMHGYVDEDGDEDEGALQSRVLSIVLGARVNARRERASVAITRPAMMRLVFPKMPGPGDFAEQEDPELAADVYGKLNTHLWTMLSTNDTGAIQSKLNGDHNVVLCRTKATSDGVDGVYVTRDLQSMLEDYTAPGQQKINRAVRQMGRNVAMAAERVPEHAKRLRRELRSGTRAALGEADIAITRLIEAGDDDGDDDE